MNPTAQLISISWKNLRLTIIQQVFAWALSAFVADFGVINAWINYAILTYWLIFVFFYAFKPSRLILAYSAYLRWGFPCIAITYLLFGNYLFTAVVNLILKFQLIPFTRFASL